MNIAIHGKKELLVRLRDDLLNKGMRDDEQWNNNRIKEGEFEWLIVYSYRLVTFFKHDKHMPNTLNLTPSNYNEILNIIIERKENGK